MLSYSPILGSLGKSPRFDTAPTETQMKSAIAQTLSQSFAYNAPVVILEFEVGDNGTITGRFKDASQPRVFTFEIKGKSVSYKPFSPNRMDSLEDVRKWEEFSQGYAYRLDAGKKGSGKQKGTKDKPICGNTSYLCGKACISLKKECKSSPKDNASEEKMNKLNDVAKEYKKAQEADEKPPQKTSSPEPIKPPPEEPTQPAKKVSPPPFVKFNYVDVSAIKSDTKKTDFPDEQIEQLSDMILETGGLLNPILLTQSGLNEFKVLSGDLEYHAAVRAKEKNLRQGELINAIVASPSLQEAMMKQSNFLKNIKNKP